MSAVSNHRIFAAFFVFVSALGVLAMPHFAYALSCDFGTDNGAGDCVGYLTSGTSWTTPADWTDSGATIEAIGAGGDGAAGTNSTNAGAGGGGGEYEQITTPGLAPGAVYDIHIPAGGDGASASGTYVKNGAGGGGSIIVEAKNGDNASDATAGAGGTGGTGDSSNDGGAGGAGGSGTTNDSGGGGGGSAGPSGIGKGGGAGVGATTRGGGGGGGSNGGSSTAGSTTASASGGDGGEGSGGSGAGAGGTGKNSNNAQSGTNGGGGGGGSQSSGGTVADGAAGGTENLWGTGVGPGGGGGGGGGCGGTGCTASHMGGAGGTYGGGAGGCGVSGSHAAANCPSTPTGGQGLLIISYVPGPHVTTDIATAVGGSSALLHATLDDDNGSSITEHGFAYSTDSALSTGVSTSTLGSFAGGSGYYSDTASGLSHDTTYYFRTYATSANGTGYGGIQSFATGDATPTRKIILFLGYTIKFISGKMHLY